MVGWVLLLRCRGGRFPSERWELCVLWCEGFRNCTSKPEPTVLVAITMPRIVPMTSSMCVVIHKLAFGAVLVERDFIIA